MDKDAASSDRSRLARSIVDSNLIKQALNLVECESLNLGSAIAADFASRSDTSMARGRILGSTSRLYHS